MFLNHRGLHYYSYLALEIIKSWGESKGMEEGGSHDSTWSLWLQCRQGSVTRAVSDMCKCGCFQADEGVKALVQSPGPKDAGPGPSGSERSRGSIGPSASSSSGLFDGACTILRPSFLL